MHVTLKGYFIFDVPTFMFYEVVEKSSFVMKLQMWNGIQHLIKSRLQCVDDLVFCKVRSISRVCPEFFVWYTLVIVMH